MLDFGRSLSHCIWREQQSQCQPQWSLRIGELSHLPVGKSDYGSDMRVGDESYVAMCSHRLLLTPSTHIEYCRGIPSQLCMWLCCSSKGLMLWPWGNDGPVKTTIMLVPTTEAWVIRWCARSQWLYRGTRPSEDLFLTKLWVDDVVLLEDVDEVITRKVHNFAEVDTLMRCSLVDNWRSIDVCPHMSDNGNITPTGRSHAENLKTVHYG